MTRALITAARVALAGSSLAIAAAVSAQAVGPASAPDGARGHRMAAELQKRFAAADKNGDGRLTKAEAEAGMPFVFKHFDEIDKAKQGSISLADVVAFTRQERIARKGATP